MTREEEIEIARKIYRTVGGRGRYSRGLRMGLYELVRAVEAGGAEWPVNASPGEWMLRRGLVVLRPNPARRGGSHGTKHLATPTPYAIGLMKGTP